MALDNEFILSELIKSGSSALKQDIADDGTIIVNTSLDTDGETFGYVERPYYNEKLLVKAVDVAVDELMGGEKKDKPAVVLKTIYDDLKALYSTSLSEIKDLEKKVDNLTTENENLKTEIEQLKLDVDLQKLLKTSADSERDATNKVLQSVTLDFQSALSKGTKEAIERVSREASLQGLLAEKEAFAKLEEQSVLAIKRANDTIDSLQNNLVDAQNNFALAANNLNAQSDKAKKKIICNELYNQGFLPKHIWDADERYGEMLYKTDPRAILGYMMWAKHVVRFMKEKPQYTKYIYFILKPWTEQMAFEVGLLPNDNWIGKLIDNIGKKYSYYVYDKRMSKRNKLSWQ